MGKKPNFAASSLTKYSNDFARSTIDRWWDLGDELWVKFKWRF